MRAPSSVTAAVGAAGATVFLGLAIAVVWSGSRPLWTDRALLHFLAVRRDTAAVRSSVRLSHFLGDWRAVVALAGVSALCLLVVRKTNASIFLLMALAVLPAGVLLKDTFHRPPPIATDPGYSFPSGHALASMTLAGALVALAWRTRWCLIAVVIAALYTAAVGAAVVAVSGHWPSDVVAGWALGIAWLSVSRLTVARWRTTDREYG